MTTKWIPASEPPAHGTKVLCYWPERTVNDCTYRESMDVTFYCAEDGFWYPGQSGESQPSHWMPLPESPKAE